MSQDDDFYDAQHDKELIQSCTAALQELALAVHTPERTKQREQITKIRHQARARLKQQKTMNQTFPNSTA